ncbi:MAG: hypothetical protein ABWY93_18530, partial [Mycobacterium sp.]
MFITEHLPPAADRSSAHKFQAQKNVPGRLAWDVVVVRWAEFTRGHTMTHQIRDRQVPAKPDRRPPDLVLAMALASKLAHAMALASQS